MIQIADDDPVSGLPRNEKNPRREKARCFDIWIVNVPVSGEAGRFTKNKILAAVTINVRDSVRNMRINNARSIHEGDKRISPEAPAGVDVAIHHGVHLEASRIEDIGASI